MLVLTPFCPKEVKILRQSLVWEQRLGGCKEHSLVLVAGFHVSKEDAQAVYDEAAKTYGKVELIRAFYEDPHGWPVNPNLMFQRGARHIEENYGCPFFMQEPDCIALRTGWLDKLEAEYKRCEKPFMGCIVQNPFPHLTGNAIYPNAMHQYNPAILLAHGRAWDVSAPECTLEQTHHTTLFQHLWSYNSPASNNGKYIEKAPTFTCLVDLEIIRPDAVILHRNKDGTLIDWWSQIYPKRRREVSNAKFKRGWMRKLEKVKVEA